MPAIEVRNLSKHYTLGETLSHDLLRDRIAHGVKRLFGGNGKHPASAGAREFWALRDVSFDVQEGEVLGVIGKNGAGKSTLLKILSRITEPTEGEVRLKGRVASLLEVGTGFHKELTGRENVFLNGAILGMSRIEIRAKFDDIVQFAGVEKFIDTPVKRYSSGMTVRLAFAVAAHLEPEVLLIDEVLAVGDAEFQKRCLGKMDEVAKGGRTILFVSHQMAAVEALCSRCAWLQSGEVAAIGETDHIISDYLSDASAGIGSSRDLTIHPGRPRQALALMTRATLLDTDGGPADTFRVHDTLRIEVEFESPNAAFSPVLGYVLKNHIGAPVFALDNRTIDKGELEEVGKGTITCEVPRIPLVPGRYTLDLYLGDRARSIDSVVDAVSFDVTPRDIYGTGRLPPPHTGSILWDGRWWLGAREGSSHDA